jgi:tetrahydromethanopterin S-methyltransferase subunit A
VTADLAILRVREALQCATTAKKCHRCGCFQDTVTALAQTPLAEPLADALAAARSAFVEQKYDCIGCSPCWPADALNDASAIVELPISAGCPTDAPERRAGWPPLPGDVEVVTYGAPVAVCTLHSLDLVAPLAQARPTGLAIVGAMQTENLGVERLIENVVANPNLRVLVVCGQDTPGAVGHFPGQALLALAADGVDVNGRIVGARGRRPVLKNVSPALIEHFRAQVRVVDRRGERELSVLTDLVEREARAAPGPMPGSPLPSIVPRIAASSPGNLVLDPAGYIVVTPDRARAALVAEHYANNGVLTCLIEGASAIDVVATLLGRGLVSRADHAAYLGRELALAELALRDGVPYRQDRAPEPPAARCDGPSCGPSCGGAG